MKKHIISAILGLNLALLLVFSYLYLNKKESTPSIWENQLNFKTYSNPMYKKDNFYILGGDKGVRKLFLFELSNRGEILNQTPNLPAAPYEPVIFKDAIVLSDVSRKIRGFSVPDLKILWEIGADQHFKVKPIKLSEDKILITGNHKTLFAVNVKDGEPEWDCPLETPIVSYAVGEKIVCLHANPKNPRSYWATAIDPKTGVPSWRITEISKNTPLAIENICVLTTDKNQTIIVDQYTGTILFKNPDTSLTPIKIIGNYLLTISKDKTRLMVTSLDTGNAWSKTLETTFQDATLINETMFIAEKKYLYAKDIKTGEQKWRLKLQDIYNLYQVNNGIFVTYKDHFTSRTTQGTLFNARTSKPIWTTVGDQLFRRPIAIPNGDFIISYNGKYKLMPSSSSEGTHLDFIKNTKKENKENIESEKEKATPQIINDLMPKRDDFFFNDH